MFNILIIGAAHLEYMVQSPRLSYTSMPLAHGQHGLLAVICPIKISSLRILSADPQSNASALKLEAWSQDFKKC